MTYVYFVSYVASDHRVGRSQVTRDKKIDSIDDIERIEDSIGHNGTVITNYILMSVIDKEGE